MSDSVLDVKNLSVDIPLAEGILHAVDDIDLHVDKGETLCIVGESGCGKSLTSLAIMDLLPKKAIRRMERLDLAGTSILDYSERQMSDIRGSKMGMIFQEPMTSLNPAFTIGNQMIETLQRHRNMTGVAARDIADFEARNFSAGESISGPKLLAFLQSEGAFGLWMEDAADHNWQHATSTSKRYYPRHRLAL